MSKYVIEVVNIRTDGGPVYVRPNATGPGMLFLSPNAIDAETRVRITAQQFQDLSYDLEGFSEGKHGVTKQIGLELRNVETGERDRVAFSEAAEMVKAGLNDDAAALADQQRQADEIAKLEADKDEDDLAEDENEA